MIRPFIIEYTDQGPVLKINARGFQILGTPLLNRGTAFTLEEREALGLTGLLPPRTTTIELQATRAYSQYSRQPHDLGKNIYLTSLHDRNEVLFYRLLSEHLREMLPVVYTPTIGWAIERYSHEYRKPRGVHLSIDRPEEMEQSFRNFGADPNDIDLIVATDAEAILGIGDWGVGGINISIGKLAVYTAAAGIDPSRAIPVMLDVGTDRESLLSEPHYLGNRHPRIRGERYDEFVDLYVKTVSRVFPNALLHWEDFSASNARRILEKYRHQCCTFNDDMQGTGAIVLAAALSAFRASGVPMQDQRVVIFGAGTAGVGIADQLCEAMVRAGLPPEQARRRFWCVDRKGLLVDTMGQALRDFQRPYARPAEELSSWKSTGPDGQICLADVVREVHPTMLIGTSTCGGAFSESIVRDMAAHTARPIIFPLSNPTTLAEATPAHLLDWTDGRALIATGSPFDPVTYRGTTYTIAQCNNSLLFPGLGLGAIVSRARKISDGMLRAAAETVTGFVEVRLPGASLLPQVEELRSVSAAVATTVARAAALEGLARAELDDPYQAVGKAMWQPVYPRIKLSRRARSVGKKRRPSHARA